MAKRMNLTQVGWRVPENVFESFKEYCEQAGSRCQDALGAAMVAWQHLPAKIQRQAQFESNGVPSLDEEFWTGFEKGLSDAIEGRVSLRQDNPVKKKTPRHD